MAICDYCQKEMKDSVSCVEIEFRFKGDPRVYKPIKYGEEGEDWGFEAGLPCHDCYCKRGDFHHVGCDVERCPRCGGQAIGCDCEQEEPQAGD